MPIHGLRCYSTSLLFFVTLISAAQGIVKHPVERPEYFLDESTLPFTGLESYPATQRWGVIDRAGYRIEVPDAWNGDLIIWAHGYRRGNQLKVDNHPIRQWILQAGFAWAASSYAYNDYEVGQAVIDTHRLRLAFNQLIAKPGKVYITGASMGAHVTALLIERWPGFYDGAMPVCGVMGDVALFDYFLNAGLAGQQLAGIQAQFPPPEDYRTRTIALIKAGLSRPKGQFPYALNTRGVEFAQLIQQLTGGTRPGFRQGFLFWNGVAGDFLLERAGLDGSPPDSTHVIVNNQYNIFQLDDDRALSSREQQINQDILRVRDDGRLLYQWFGYFASMPQIIGNIKRPVLTLHTLGDLFVPFHMQQIYQTRVASFNRTRFLVQRAIRDFRHCSFTQPEYIQGMQDLVKWVEEGIKPDGDAVMDSHMLRQESFGCKFTTPDRHYEAPLTIPAC